jgi:hypothetical protein
MYVLSISPDNYHFTNHQIAVDDGGAHDMVVVDNEGAEDRGMVGGAPEHLEEAALVDSTHMGMGRGEDNAQVEEAQDRGHGDRAEMVDAPLVHGAYVTDPYDRDWDRTLLDSCRFL